MRKIFVILFVGISASCFAQVEKVFDDFKNSTPQEYQHVDKLDQLPEAIRKQIRKKFPDSRRMPLISDEDYTKYKLGKTNYLWTHTPRIFERAFFYKDYLVINYLLMNGRARSVRIVVLKLDVDQKIDFMLFKHRWIFDSAEKFYIRQVKRNLFVDWESPDEILFY